MKSYLSWVLLLLLKTANADSLLDFTVVVSAQNVNLRGSQGSTPSTVQVADQLVWSIAKSTRTKSLEVLSTATLDSPAPEFNLEQAALQLSEGSYALNSELRTDLQIVLKSKDNLDILPFPEIIKLLGKDLSRRFEAVNAIAFISKGQQDKPVYFFPALEGRRRIPDKKNQDVIDFWKDRAQFAKPIDLVVDDYDGGDRMLRHDSRELLAVNNDAWAFGGVVQTAAGRILFAVNGSYYVCSGTAVSDTASDRSVILTAAHCVYDDVNKMFASNVMFIPNQNATSATKTDFSCNNDPLGCWLPSFGVVDVGWTTKSWPANNVSDYGYYVVSNTGANSGSLTVPSALDQAVTTMPINFTSNPAGQNGHGLGYPYNYDPNFRYCSDTIVSMNYGYRLPACNMTGGSSGGPWVSPMNTATGFGPIVSVNSYTYSSNPTQMGGPSLRTTSSQCLFSKANTLAFTTGGYVIDGTTACPVSTPTSSPVPPPTPAPVRPPTLAPVASTCTPLKTGCNKSGVTCCSNETCNKVGKAFKCLGKTGATCTRGSDCLSNSCINSRCT